MDESDVCEIQYVDEQRVRSAARAMRSPDAVYTLCETFRALGDPTRMQIAWALAHQELCVCDLAQLLGLSQSRTSHSLRALRHLRIVTFRREGKIAYYRLNDAHVANLLTDGFRHAAARG